MSASQEKKNSQHRAEREERRRQEERANRRTMALYTGIGGAVILLAVVLMVWTSGILQRSLPALTVGDTKYTAVELQYYYTSAYSNAVNNSLSTLGMYPFDTGTSTKKQVYDEETGQTWYDYLMEEAVQRLSADTALAQRAAAEGYTLSEDARSELDSFLSQLNTAWLSYNYANLDAFVRANYGSYMSYDRLVTLLEQEALANDYARAKAGDISHSEEEYQSYYQENADRLDTFQYNQFTFQARVDSTDGEGNSVELTEAERAAQLEERKAEQLALAQELQGRLDAGEDPEDVAKAYEDRLYSTTYERQNLGSSLTGSTYADWLLDGGRKAGDTTLTEYDGGSVYNYYVTQFQSRARDNSGTADVRHVLVAAEQDPGASEPTQAQYDAAKSEAEALLAEWQAGEATEDSFAQLARENSADSGSASDGGLISNINRNSGYVEEFQNWALDPGRKPGDTGLVQNTGSSTKGWHIMYYVSAGDPIWRQTADNALRTADYEALEEEVLSQVTVQTGMGANLVSA